MRRKMWTAVVAALTLSPLLMFAAPTTASASPQARTAPQARTVINTGVYYYIVAPDYGTCWYINEASRDGNYPGPYILSDSTNGATGFCTDAGFEWQNAGWTQIVNNDTGKCLSYDATNNSLNDQPCHGYSWQLWNSKEAPGRNEWFWNQWEQNNYPYACGTTYQPVISTDGYDVYLECPDVSTYTYGSDQSWDPVYNIFGTG